jgi:formin 2/WAS/WASL-interacting protein
MGFMDKAKKLAEQAQEKLDEVQKQFNESPPGSTAPQGPAVEYDQHGRPIRREEPAATPPHGDPLEGDAAPPPTPAPPPAAAAAPPAPPSAPAPVPDPAAPPPGGPTGTPDEDRNKPSYAPPKLSSGDPLAN